MPNMSYCRWQNTLNDFVDCVNNIGRAEDPLEGEETWVDVLGHDEHRAMMRLVEATADLLEGLDGEADSLSDVDKDILMSTVRRIANGFGFYEGASE